MSRLLSRAVLVVVGGALLGAEKECLNSIEVLEECKFRLLKQTMKQSRRSPALLNHNNQMLILGGCSGTEHLDDAETLREGSIACSQLKFPHGGFSCAAYCQLKNGTGWIFGGYNGCECLDQVYCIEGQKVKNKPPLMSRLKNSTAIAASDQEVLLFGGWDERQTLDTVFAYRTEDGSSSFHSKLPYPIEGHSAVRYKNSVYIFGGYDGISVVDTIVRFDLTTRKSEILPSKLKIARENHVSALLEENGQPYLLVIGGWNGSQALRSCERLEIEENLGLRSVDCQLELNQPRNRPAASVIDGCQVIEE